MDVRKYNGKRHTLLHKPKQNRSVAETSELTSELVVEEASQVNTFFSEDILVAYGILSTSLVQILYGKGETHSRRVLLDNGSQSNFVTKDFCETLKLKIDHTNISLSWYYSNCFLY